MCEEILLKDNGDNNLGWNVPSNNLG
jgi:hypothetical protein